MTDDHDPPIDAAGLAKMLGYSGPSAIFMRRARGLPLPPAVQIPGRRQMFWRLSTVEAWMREHEKPVTPNRKSTPSAGSGRRARPDVGFTTPGRKHPAQRNGNRRHH